MPAPRFAPPPQLPRFVLTRLLPTEIGRVDCRELQWWFVIPVAGETHAAVWYDRADGAATMVRETGAPVSDAERGDGSTLVTIDEWTLSDRAEPSAGWTRRAISFIAGLTDQQAEFREVTMDGTTVRPDQPAFGDWSGGSGRELSGELCDVTVDDRTFRCVQVIDLPAADGTEEIGAALIDVVTGRTVAYWQYRPVGWDPDSAEWLETHPGHDITISGQRFQRRNCTGRDELCLTNFALGLNP